ncbi:MAG TPA: AAA family ATPase, partial [Candidatus Dormibacteraeota bacterium]
MATRVLLTGAMGLESADVAIRGDSLRGRRARVLLALLVSERHRPVPCDEMAEALWPGELPASWEPSLRAVASEVRAFLASAGLNGSEVLTSAFGCYQLRLPADTEVDLELAAASVTAAQAALDAGEPRTACEHARLAHSVAVRPLLPGVEGAWVERKRLELRGLVNRSLELLAEGHCRSGEPRLAVAAAEEALRVEPYRESAHRCLMVAHAAAGNRADALRAYERCRELLAEELGVDPSSETRAVHLALLREQPAEPGDGRPEPLMGRARWSSVAPASRLPPALQPAGSPTFVGREAELDQLSMLWRETLAGRGRLVLIGGEPGIGKTRLAAELATRAGADGAVVLFGHCDEGVGIPYQPFIEALGLYVAVAPDEVLQSVTETYAAEVAMLLPGLARRLPTLPAATESAAQRYRLFQAVAALMDAAAGASPLLLVLDDLQWADRGTLLLLGHLARTVGSSGLLALATFRDTDLDRAIDLAALLAELRRERAVARMSMRGLGDAEVGRLMAAVIGRELDPVDVAARAIHADTEGNPFYVCELVRHLAETAGENQGLAATATAAAGRVPVPEGVREVVRRRLTHLTVQA